MSHPMIMKQMVTSNGGITKAGRAIPANTELLRGRKSVGPLTQVKSGTSRSAAAAAFVNLSWTVKSLKADMHHSRK